MLLQQRKSFANLQELLNIVLDENNDCVAIPEQMLEPEFDLTLEQAKVEVEKLQLSARIIADKAQKKWLAVAKDGDQIDAFLEGDRDIAFLAPDELSIN